MKIIILTANEYRHKFFRKYLNNNKNLEVSLTICENNKERQSYKVLNSKNTSILQKKHFSDRAKNERVFFKKYINSLKEPNKKLIINRGEININKNLIKKVIEINPDYIISYGCGLVNNNIIKKFKNKFINIHLGLSPYYRGSGSNYWPLVNNEPQLVGVTFMKIDKGIDTGPILHQMRGVIKYKDNVHEIGNRVIFKMTKELIKILTTKKKFTFKKKEKKMKLYYKKDFNDQSIMKLKKNFKKGMIKNYLINKRKIDNKFKIVQFKY